MEKSDVEIDLDLIDRFIETLIHKGKSELTAKTYRYVMNAFEKYLVNNCGDLYTLTRHDIKCYLKHLEIEGKCATTLKKNFAVISIFAKYLKRPEIIEDIRLPEVRKVRHIAPNCLERNELNRLLREVERKGCLRTSAIVHILLHTGIRISELTALNRDDIIIGKRGGSLRVRNGKGNISRTIPLSSDSRLHLSRYLETRDEQEHALFLSNYKQRISIRAVQHTLKKFGVHPHQLRHTFCRQLVSRGIDIPTVGELAGHADINVTRRYSRPTPNELIDAIDKAFP